MVRAGHRRSWNEICLKERIRIETSKEEMMVSGESGENSPHKGLGIRAVKNEVAWCVCVRNCKHSFCPDDLGE